MTLVGWCFEQLGISSLYTLNEQEFLPLETNILEQEAEERYAGYATARTVRLPGPSSDTLLSCARFIQCVTFILVFVPCLEGCHNFVIVKEYQLW
jgi:hypothetical protein